MSIPRLYAVGQFPVWTQLAPLLDYLGKSVLNLILSDILWLYAGVETLLTGTEGLWMFRRSLTDRRLTDSARTIVEQAPCRASDRGLHHVDAASYVMLLLWTLVRWERKPGLLALKTIGVDLDRLCHDLDQFLTRKADENPVVIDRRSGKAVFRKTGKPFVGWEYDSIADPILDQAEQESRQMGHDYVGSEHLLLAIIKTADPELKRSLDDHLITSENIRATLLESL